MAAIRLIDAGRLNVERRVDQYLPDFVAPAGRNA